MNARISGVLQGAIVASVAGMTWGAAFNAGLLVWAIVGAAAGAALCTFDQLRGISQSTPIHRSSTFRGIVAVLMIGAMVWGTGAFR